MRTPNSKCVICEKPLYRRPFELKRVRHVACMAHRGEAQHREGLTDKQQAGLALGREKGTNHLDGIPKSPESNRRRAESIKRWCADNPAQAIARAEKNRAEGHYLWKGGSSKLNNSIRRMTESRRWMDRIKERDRSCVRCRGVGDLESHHLIPLARLIERLNVKSREDARRNAAELWDLANGVTLCIRCHYKEHGRAYAGQ